MGEEGGTAGPSQARSGYTVLGSGEEESSRSGRRPEAGERLEVVEGSVCSFLFPSR